MVRLGVIGSGAVVQRIHWPVLQQMSRQIRIVEEAHRSTSPMIGSMLEMMAIPSATRPPWTIVDRVCRL